MVGKKSSFGGFAKRVFFAAAVSLACCGAVCTAAVAETPPEFLWQAPGDQNAGSGAGRLANPRGVAVNPNTGHVLVAEYKNARISEFTAWGEFVRAWGFDVTPGGSTGLETCTSACQSGAKGEAAGQMAGPTGIEVDATGAVYVYDPENLRVTKYSEDGEFLLMLGGNVNKTTGAEICTAADVEGGNECGAGAPGAEPGFFSNGNFSDFIDLSKDGTTIFVGDKDRIQAFDLNGAFVSQIPFTGELEFLSGQAVFGLAVDPVSGDIYVSTNTKLGLYRLSETGDFLESISGTVQVDGAPKTFPVSPAGLATDSQGNLFVIDHPAATGYNGPFEILKFSPTGECLICGAKFAQPDTLSVFGKGLMGIATSDACGIPGDDLYASVFNGFDGIAYLEAFGPAPQDVINCPPPEIPPEITDQYAVDVGIGDAEVGARINPHFWPDTRYYVQYGPQACLDSGWTVGCVTEPLPPGDLLTDKVVNGSQSTAPVRLLGLEPDTLYHFRFVAQSTGGGPVFGDSTSFRTFPLPLPPKTDCLNQSLRLGESALLPDCRAYEMVSPVDKDGGEVETQSSLKDYPSALDLSSIDGNSATYSSSTAFADAISSPYSSQYLAKRDPGTGWQTHAISPPRKELFGPAGSAQTYELDLQFKRFSPDLTQAWLMHEADPPLESCAVENYINWYRRDNSSDGYEAITTKKPPSKQPLQYYPEVQGVSEDGTRTIFRANDKLSVDSGPAAASIGGYQLYEHIAEAGTCGKTRLVSVLPDGTASGSQSSAGTGATGIGGFTFVESRESSVHNAVSDDGNVVYWTAASEGPGQLYVRVNGTTTLKVSAGTNARFWSAAADGSFAYYTEGEKLFRYTLGSGTSTEIADQVVGLLGASEDGQRAYFVSKKAISGVGTQGQPNLYGFDQGTTTFIGTLSTGDIDVNLPLRPANQVPTLRTASVSEDGRFVAFASDASLTGHNNTDATSGLPDTEAYFYEADSAALRCVSCPATGARPDGRVIQGFNNASQGYAAGIPPWKNQFHRPRVISEDGSTVFFESLERLVPRDTNGTIDVYMWRRAGDEAACEAIGAELFDAAAGGCISLISSGTGKDDAVFVDSTPDGSNAFFKTSTSLLPQDPNRVDLYDARVGGGFPQSAGCPDSRGCPPPVEPDEPGPPPQPSPPSGGGNPDFSACERLEAKAARQRAKSAKLRKKAHMADGAKARSLRKQAKKATMKAKAFSHQAKSCNAQLRGK